MIDHDVIRFDDDQDRSGASIKSHVCVNRVSEYVEARIKQSLRSICGSCVMMGPNARSSQLP